MRHILYKRVNTGKASRPDLNGQCPVPHLRHNKTVHSLRFCSRGLSILNKPQVLLLSLTLVSDFRWLACIYVANLELLRYRDNCRCYPTIILWVFAAIMVLSTDCKSQITRLYFAGNDHRLKLSRLDFFNETSAAELLHLSIHTQAHESPIVAQKRNCCLDLHRVMGRWEIIFSITYSTLLSSTTTSLCWRVVYLCSHKAYDVTCY